MDLAVSFAKAALGGEEKIKTLKEEVVMKIPEGTQSGKVFRMRGEGMPDVHGGHGFGDLYVRVMIAVPGNLSHRQRELMEELSRELGENNAKASLKDKFKKALIRRLLPSLKLLLLQPPQLLVVAPAPAIRTKNKAEERPLVIAVFSLSLVVFYVIITTSYNFKLVVILLSNND